MLTSPSPGLPSSALPSHQITVFGLCSNARNRYVTDMQNNINERLGLQV
jgi:hypothetical protein